MKTVFIRAIEAAVEQKPAALLAAVRGPSPLRFELGHDAFSSVPGSPFAYWISPRVAEMFTEHKSLSQSGVRTAIGASTKNDFRYLRLSTEVDALTIGRTREETLDSRNWVRFAKGGKYSQFYADLTLVVNWRGDGHELKTDISEYRGRRGWGYQWSAALNGHDHYFRPGLTWPRRTNGLSFRLLPQGCIFADKGPALFVEQDQEDQLLALCALVNSSAFSSLVAVQLARTELAQSFEVGLIQQTPIPSLDDNAVAVLAYDARRGWTLKRRLETRTENAHAFLLPALLQAEGDSAVDRAQSWVARAARTQAELEALATEIDNHAYCLYGISEQDRQRIEQGFGTSGEAEESPDDDDGDESNEDGDVAEVDAAPMVASLLSWSVGVAFGRFDVRLATGEREAPPEPEPFAPLPVCSPGMLRGDDGLPVAAPPAGYPLTFPTDGILVDDPGHPRDVVRAVRAVFDTVFDDANARWHEAAQLLGTPDLRTWFARDFFEPHIKRYSKSRRKAPIYWQLATASGSTRSGSTSTAPPATRSSACSTTSWGRSSTTRRPSSTGSRRRRARIPSAAQRREIEQQEGFVGELQALKTEVARVAPLWKPNLDDGVILNFAPLWRLVPQSRSWQGECKKAWDKLQGGDYDWAHLAMHLWPERVVPKCIDDRSLAIAHGLEDVFWHEDDSGTWRKSRVDDATVQKLIQERTSTTVKAALKDLLSAATPTASKGRRQGPGRRVQGSGRPPRKVSPAESTAGSRKTGTLNPDPGTLKAVKAAIASVADGASKADVLAATGLSDGDWNKAIAALLDRGDVTRTGQKRGTRYHADSPGEDG
jgi:hypothetical protein